jgi:hypothetical protein
MKAEIYTGVTHRQCVVLGGTVSRAVIVVGSRAGMGCRSRVASSCVSHSADGALPPSPLTVRNSAPRLLACSRTASRVSKTRTIAPRDLAAPMAASPATPPPMTNTLAGGTLPAAVICPVKNRPKWWAASITALQVAAQSTEHRGDRAADRGAVGVSAGAACCQHTGHAVVVLLLHCTCRTQKAGKNKQTCFL